MKKTMLSGLFILIALLASQAQVSLTIQCTTGGDDLRGGNDNVHLVVLTRQGTPVRFEHLNDRKKWANNTTQTCRRTLPSGIAPEDIVGIRLEFTGSGGAGGDNWNLDRLVVTADAGKGIRKLFEQSGKPLVRFTGSKRVEEFRFGTIAPAPAKAVMTRFNPGKHGFAFSNRFKNIVVSELDITTGGLCGGMVYASLDYYFAGKPVPTQTYMPAEGELLQQYLYDRQVQSLVRNVDKWGEIGFNPNGARDREFYNWGLQAGSGRLGELMSRIDKGTPVPLGLQDCGDGCHCDENCPGNHQVLAIGYELGRYQGDLGNFQEDVAIYVYDPNFPGKTMTLKPVAQGGWYQYKEESRCRWRTYFVDAQYRRATPPVITGKARELVVEFRTGDDDLRGGKDNVHLIVLLRSGKSLRFDNVNNSKRWIGRSSQSVSRVLPEEIGADQIAGIRLETTFGGGMSGDNWNLDRLTVRLLDRGASNTLYDKSGKPLFRFTGSQKTREFRF